MSRFLLVSMTIEQEVRTTTTQTLTHSSLTIPVRHMYTTIHVLPRYGWDCHACTCPPASAYANTTQSNNSSSNTTSAPPPFVPLPFSDQCANDICPAGILAHLHLRHL